MIFFCQNKLESYQKTIISVFLTVIKHFLKEFLYYLEIHYLFRSKKICFGIFSKNYILI